MNTSEMQCQHVFRIGTEIGAKVLKMERVARKYELAPRELTETEKKRPKVDFSRPINNSLRKLEKPE
jgi:predicted RNA-binding protein with RPS1 domain